MFTTRRNIISSETLDRDNCSDDSKEMSHPCAQSALYRAQRDELPPWI